MHSCRRALSIIRDRCVLQSGAHLVRLIEPNGLAAKPRGFAAATGGDQTRVEHKRGLSELRASDLFHHTVSFFAETPWSKHVGEAKRAMCLDKLRSRIGKQTTNVRPTPPFPKRIQQQAGNVVDHWSTGLISIGQPKPCHRPLC